MRGRIRNLESLVVNLINQKQQEGYSNPSVASSSKEGGEDDTEKESDDSAADTFGQLRISSSGTETSYVGAGHWSSLLQGIEELKQSLEEDELAEFQENEWSEDSARGSISFGVPKPMTKAQLIEQMPPKEQVDRIIPLWFNRYDIFYILIAHGLFNSAAPILICSLYMHRLFKRSIANSGEILFLCLLCGLLSCILPWL
jgi:hypothetical protein